MMKRHMVIAGILAFGLLSGMTSNVSFGEEILCGFVYKYWDNVQGCQFVPMELCDGGIVYLDDPPEDYMGRYMKFINPEWVFARCESGGEVRVMWNAQEAYFISSCAECGSPEECEEWLIVKCNIAGYELYIDGDYRLTEDGDGECGIKLEAGTYSVKLKKDGCDTVTETAQIECGHSTTIWVTMNCREDCNNGRDDDGDGRIDCDDSDCRNDSDCDPCGDIHCENECFGCDYWAMRCVQGECEKDYIIERDSERCGCGVNPCGEDKDHDGVNDCEDKCSDTPEWMSRVLNVDDEGCLYCLDKETRCAASVTLLMAIPTLGIENIILDFCEIVARLADGDTESAINEIPNLVRDIIFTAVRVLAGLITLPVGAPSEMVLDALQTMLTCLPALSSSEVEAVYEESVQMMADENIDVLSFYVGSPVDVRVTDGLGNTLDQSTNEIKDSYIFSIGEDKIGMIVKPEGEYKIEVLGTESGTYDLRIKATKGGRIAYDERYADIQTSRGEVDLYDVETEEGKEEASIVYSFPLIVIGMLFGLIRSRKRRK